MIPEQRESLYLKSYSHGDSSALGAMVATDVFTGWTEIQAVRNKTQVWVVEAMELLEQRSPFTWFGLASDNGAEFMNKHLLPFCESREITFTRTRAYRKNDNPHVEQKKRRPLPVGRIWVATTRPPWPTASTCLSWYIDIQLPSRPST